MGDFHSVFYQWTQASMFVPMLVAPANGGFYTSNSATIFSLVASKDGNNVYHSVNNGYASFNKPMLALTTYKPVAALPPLPSAPTYDHRKKELNISRYYVNN